MTFEEVNVWVDSDKLDKMSFANVYEIDRAWGGPEEGGWWYDCAVPVKSARVFDDNLFEVEAALKAWCAEQNEGSPDIGSVLSEGEYVVRLESSPAKAWPEHRPHYE